MDDTPGERFGVSDGLIRQRRNLIVCSIVFILVAAGGAKLGALNVGFSSVTFERPEVLYAAIWIIQIYFLVRYLQYLGSEEMLSEAVSKLWRGKANQYLNERFRDASLVGGADRWFYVNVALWGPSKTLEGGNRARLVGHLRFGKNADPNGEVVPFYSNELPLRGILWDHIKASTFVLCWHPFGTDFVLPVILATAAIAVGVVVEWNGAPANWLTSIFGT